MALEELPPDVVAPCGCRLVTRYGEDRKPVVTMVPHDINCELVNLSIDFAVEQDKTTYLRPGIQGWTG